MYQNTVVVLVIICSSLYQTCGELANIPPTEQTTRKKTEDRREQGQEIGIHSSAREDTNCYPCSKWLIGLQSARLLSSKGFWHALWRNPAQEIRLCNEWDISWCSSSSVEVKEAEDGGIWLVMAASQSVSQLMAS